MIRSFGDDDTEDLFYRVRVPHWSVELQKIALRKLLMLHAAPRLEDLSALPGNRLKKLAGARKERYSIRINEQWRICFRWRDGDAYEVQIVDYH